MSVSPAAMRKLMREISEMKKSPPEGIRVQTSDDNLLDVVGIIQGPEGTPYAGGYFKVKFRFTEEFPQAPPKCSFMTKIFHPNVSSSGEICVNTLKKDWQPTYGICHILVTIKCLLIYPNPESALDEEAGKLLLENYKSYCDRAKLITSVHATPRVRPVEFDTPSAEEQQKAESSTSVGTTTATSTSATSIPTKTSTPSTISAQPPMSTNLNLAISIATPSGPRKSLSPVPQSHALPLTSSPSNISSEKTDLRERHTSPAPLSTADANVDSSNKTTTSGTGMAKAALGSGGVQPAKAVKRAAGGGATNAEKRKKALKRL
ncbi:ubiquitin conjugating enzyme e2 [Moniliophthora roreri MCA 2997]|uniref:E2 ubiquitin-conjugating enzyme n=1 Tax=Moniliophthora roreri (strain MCA 2997) TaxID=1381753 RepID=V2WWP6_MONRO|nr:ubiquitin conjugating enzyme e2 [Moniliophthora roreri MCA 2997]